MIFLILMKGLLTYKTPPLGTPQPRGRQQEEEYTHWTGEVTQ